jgi:hypothetical protein
LSSFPLPDQVEDKLRGKPWIPAGVYPDENRGRNDKLEKYRLFAIAPYLFPHRVSKKK